MSSGGKGSKKSRSRANRAPNVVQSCNELCKFPRNYGDFIKVHLRRKYILFISICPAYKYGAEVGSEIFGFNNGTPEFSDLCHVA